VEKEWFLIVFFLLPIVGVGVKVVRIVEPFVEYQSTNKCWLMQLNKLMKDARIKGGCCDNAGHTKDVISVAFSPTGQHIVFWKW
jgi:hypothetical protein